MWSAITSALFICLATLLLLAMGSLGCNSTDRTVVLEVETIEGHGRNELELDLGFGNRASVPIVNRDSLELVVEVSIGGSADQELVSIIVMDDRFKRVRGTASVEVNEISRLTLRDSIVENGIISVEFQRGAEIPHTIAP